MKLHASLNQKLWLPEGLLVGNLGPIVSAGVPFLLAEESRPFLLECELAEHGVHVFFDFFSCTGHNLGSEEALGK